MVTWIAERLPHDQTVAGTFSTLGGSFFLPQARAVNTFHVEDSIAWIKVNIR